MTHYCLMRMHTSPAEFECVYIFHLMSVAFLRPNYEYSHKLQTIFRPFHIQFALQAQSVEHTTGQTMAKKKIAKQTRMGEQHSPPMCAQCALLLVCRAFISIVIHLLSSSFQCNLMTLFNRYTLLCTSRLCALPALYIVSALYLVCIFPITRTIELV